LKDIGEKNGENRTGFDRLLNNEVPMSHKIRFMPSGREVESREGRTILEEARDGGVALESPCGGNGKCGKCRVRLVEGQASAFVEGESSFIGEEEREEGWRLACRAKAEGDLQVFIPDTQLFAAGRGIKKEFAGRVRRVRPAVKSYSVQVDGEGNGKDFPCGTMGQALREKTGVAGLIVDDAAVNSTDKEVPGNCGEWSAAVWMDKEVIRLVRGGNGPVLGVALDVGTTTVAVYLCDLGNGKVLASSSFANPQIVFGADVISRIGYSAHHPGVGVQRMQRDLVEEINRVIEELTTGVGHSPRDVLDMTMVGNTVMHHIFLLIPPDSLGLSPFQPVIETSTDRKARDLGVRIHPAAYVHILPVEAGFVGADNVAVVISEEPYKKEEPVLIVDVGTNGEIVLGNRERLFSCSCATGPALEGAGISSGMRGVKGAIERMHMERDTFEVSYRVIGHVKPSGVCGSGIIDAVAELYGCGVIDEGGAFRKTVITPRLRKDNEGLMEFVVAWGRETLTGRDICISQRDVRQIQLAKGALRAGCEILMRYFGINKTPRVVIAGAFGMHIDRKSALAIGLFPTCSPDNISLAGNAAGHGAYLALMDVRKRKEADRIARWINHIELAREADFQKEFLKAIPMPTPPLTF
jgi:uncharacterized 2Fe-2S/4Fe-4S cluster protein (DUF4445 family)